MYECDYCGNKVDTENGLKVHKSLKHFDSLEDRFWDKVNIKDDTECWPWNGGTRKGGYGCIRVDGKVKSATRVLYEDIKNQDLGKKQVLHKCDNKNCINPKHLYLGDRSNNMQDMWNRNDTSNRRGEAWHQSDLKDVEVVSLKVMRKNCDFKIVEIAEYYPVEYSTLSNILNGNSWEHLEILSPDSDEGDGE